ncbi:uncharacterized protein LOC111077699 [Drosophila obscura]|uniref:uncharacterized protein LOC111077699 n=1 Tax=Drosophila obscura TaxID=7282 RepID=UPI001BB26F81|nr:uncharacterized protein LOC111077699 [Drosophila obscura]XP_022227762.2 uncharacterized protein LOC111077699 [Drosophila obscura]
MATFYWLFLIASLPNHGVAAKTSTSTNRLSLLWKTYDCTTNPEFVARHKCIIMDYDKSMVTTEFEYIRGISQLNATFKLFLPRPPFKQYHKIIDLNIDICQFSKGLFGHKFIAVIVKALGKSALQMKCPRPKGIYSYPNISVAVHLPAFLPETNFKVEINFLTPAAYLVNSSLSGMLYDSAKTRVK